jgi:hypothetical protein
MQTLANLSSSRDVLRQVEINNGAMARLEGYYANYKEALKHQLDTKKPELLEALSSSSAGASAPSTPTGRAPTRRVASASFMGASTHSPPPQSEAFGRPTTTSMALTGAASGPSGMRRRKSLRESIGSDQLMNTVNTLATKVISSNDRYSRIACETPIVVCLHYTRLVYSCATGCWTS